MAVLFGEFRLPREQILDCKLMQSRNVQTSERESPVHVSPLEYLRPVVVYEHPGQRQKLEETAANESPRTLPG